MDQKPIKGNRKALTHFLEFGSGFWLISTISFPRKKCFVLFSLWLEWKGSLLLMIYRAVRRKMRTHFKRMAKCFLGETTLRSFLTLLSNWSGGRGVHRDISFDIPWYPLMHLGNAQDRPFSFLVNEKQNLRVFQIQGAILTDFLFHVMCLGSCMSPGLLHLANVDRNLFFSVFRWTHYLVHRDTCCDIMICIIILHILQSIVKLGRDFGNACVAQTEIRVILS